MGLAVLASQEISVNSEFDVLLANSVAVGVVEFPVLDFACGRHREELISLRVFSPSSRADVDS